jgi:hypothetical protein
MIDPMDEARLDADLALAGGDLETRLSFSALGERALMVRDLASGAEAAATWPGGPILIGVDRTRALPAAGQAYDVLLTTAPGAPQPWVPVADIDAALAQIQATVAHRPVASSVASSVVRTSEGLSFERALTIESLAYSTLLGGQEFRHWRSETPRSPHSDEDGPPVRLERLGDALRIILTRPKKRNALSAAMRDGLCEALGLVALDPSLVSAELSGEGENFCAGGDFQEFGAAGDLALAHILRQTASAALAAHRVKDRLSVRGHGAIVGGGLEIAAAAGDFRVHPSALMWLPEVTMGLIPGAGGTVTVPRRIGRQRALYMMLTAARINVATALDWGLIDGVST